MNTNIRLLSTLTFLPLALACGDELVGNNYEGDPLAVVGGDLQILPSTRPSDEVQVELIWHVESSVDFKVNQSVTITDASLGQYQLELMVPPPDSALGTDPETGGKLGFASLFAYDDPRNEGPLDLSQYEPKDYATLIHRFRGGASNVMLAYARDAFPAGSRIANELGGPVSPGFFLVRFEGDCLCRFPSGDCRDAADMNCARNRLVPLPIDTRVTVTLVNDISEYTTVHAPDWLFL